MQQTIRAISIVLKFDRFISRLLYAFWPRQPLSSRPPIYESGQPSSGQPSGQLSPANWRAARVQRLPPSLRARTPGEENPPQLSIAQLSTGGTLPLEFKQGGCSAHSFASLCRNRTHSRFDNGNHGAGT